MKIIIGLGNPGEQYKTTRHNLGFMAIDALAKQLNAKWRTNKKIKSQIAEADGLILIKPMTFMNNSGQAVQAVLNYYKLLPKKLGFMTQKNSNLSDILTIIHDDKDIKFGEYKISLNSRSAGHKGVSSIINYLKTKNFQRIRIGIKPNNEFPIPIIKYVLGRFKQEELKAVNILIADLANKLIKFANTLSFPASDSEGRESRREPYKLL
ncbi:aminoacyl-tRNA hydrolase [bacterium]|nr:aminoacyl-tRNA hydrolase [bacterium]